MHRRVRIHQQRQVVLHRLVRGARGHGQAVAFVDRGQIAPAALRHDRVEELVRGLLVGPGRPGEVSDEAVAEPLLVAEPDRPAVAVVLLFRLSKDLVPARVAQQRPFELDAQIGAHQCERAADEPQRRAVLLGRVVEDGVEGLVDGVEQTGECGGGFVLQGADEPGQVRHGVLELLGVDVGMGRAGER